MQVVLLGFLILSNVLLPICRLEDGWKGIRVFQTTRSDVEKKLGKPISETGAGAKYDDGDVFIRVQYSTNPCSEKGTFSGDFTVPKNTVLRYYVIHKKETYLDELDWTPEEYNRATGGHFGFRVYYGSAKGISFSTVPAGEREKLETITFEYTLSDKLKYTCK